MIINKLDDAPAFVALDLGPGVPSVGIVRNARKILEDGAKTIARSVTYGFAVFEQQRGGASGGINATGDERAEAVQGFVAGSKASVEAGSLSIDPGKGVSHEELAPLAEVDQRSALHRTLHDGDRVDDLAHARGVADVAHSAVGGLDGKTAAVEVFDDAGAILVRELTARGVTVASLSTEAGTVALAEGFDGTAVMDGWRASQHNFLSELGDTAARNKVLGADVDLLFIGSKTGVLAHQGVPYTKAKTIVPNGAVPLTTKAFVMLRDAGHVVVPDFVSCGGRMLSWFTEATDVDDLLATNTDALSTVWDDIANHQDGPLMGACKKAESYLQSWQETQPFGRPLA